MVAEEQQVEVDLSRPPALTLDPTHGALQALQGDKQGHGPVRRGDPGRHAQSDGRVEEVALLHRADRACAVQPRHTGQRRPGQRPQRRGSTLQRRLRLTDVGAETDVGELMLLHAPMMHAVGPPLGPRRRMKAPLPAVTSTRARFLSEAPLRVGERCLTTRLVEGSS